MGDCPNRRFVSILCDVLLSRNSILIGHNSAFRSLHHLTHATNQLDAAFGKTFEMKKCGLEMGDAMGGRLNDGRTENITIEYNSDIGGHGGWKTFVEQLTKLEDDWDHEGVSVL